jgi:hypothetical protein
MGDARNQHEFLIRNRHDVHLKYKSSSLRIASDLELAVGCVLTIARGVAYPHGIDGEQQLC